MNTAPTITIRQGEQEEHRTATEAETVLELVQRSGFTVAAPCGGSGTCGKCLVRVVRGTLPEPTTMERRLLSERRLAGGTRFACGLAPEADMVVEVPDWHGGTANKSASVTTHLENDPVLVKRALQVDKPSLEDQRPDLDRILAALDGDGADVDVDEDADAAAAMAVREEPAVAPSLTALQELAAVLRREDFSVTALLAREDASGRSAAERPRLRRARLLAVEAGDTTAALWGIAVDIGTTTVAAYLVDLTSAHTVDVYSELNRQTEFGADVVTRISWSQKNGVAPVQKRVVAQINEMIATLAGRNGLSPDTVYCVLVAGNTTMLHFFTGLDPAGIGVSPFIPVATGALTLRADEPGIAINRHGRVGTLPGISGYVGADVVAAIIASRMQERREINLLIDIGTNGEIVLGNDERMVACSTAAGPAFEGAQIRFGVGGIAGAVNTVSLDGTITTIDSVPATGICGSGMLDVAAMLLRTGVVDATGRLLPEEELPDTVPAGIRTRCCVFEGSPAYLVVPAEQTRDGEAIYLTEQDVRELQLAKAAIAAGIDTLLKAADVSIEGVATVYLAGGFGSYMNAESALTVGLLPAGAAGKVEVLGNAAGIGTVMAITSRASARECARVAHRVRYIELSSSPDFQLAYIEQMTFGEV